MIPREDRVEERISERDDLDGLHDDTPIEDADRRLARLVLGLAAALAVGLLAVLVALWARPAGQVVIERWPNGYTRTRTTYGPSVAGQEPLAEGPYQAFHADGSLAEEGRYAAGQRSGTWRFLGPDGRVDGERSGTYVQGVRTAPLPR